MHKIERLLQTLAPKGVEFRKLGDIILSLKTGLNPRKFFKLNTPNANNYYVTVRELEEHTIKFTHQTDRIDDNALSLCLKRSNLEKDDILFSGTGTIGKVSIIKENPNNWAIKEGIYSIKPNKKIVFPRFLMFCFENLNIQNDIKSKSFGGIVKSISMNDLQQITIPIPPLEIQQEIVKILDAFTELKARKKQYEYYQNMLLDFNDINQNHKDAKIKTYPKRLKTLLHTLAPKGVEFKTLEEVFEIKNGYTPSKNNPEFWKNGTIPWFRMEDIRENGRILKDSIQHITPKALKGKKLFPKNSIIISTTATIGEHALLIVDSLANQRFTFLSKKANCDLALDMKFFFYQCFLLGEWCKNNTNVSGFASVDMTAFKKYKFPIPPLEIQQEIVKILDQFSLLTTDLLAGIPAEIKARKKQYEYYREKLLTFKPLTPHKEVKKRVLK
ncbi:restriction endonuclease subunit S [Helicobacter pylori]|uniref:restriction endonuclease subunit S n=1 Tax=Helicobacter pylori TaxID=210 RepID=UPI0029287EA0|nr:restriction endonuclease subunit S [Helicobacter pylori]MDU9764246.1 restriction endonuclease subunit S [Helicobacter pylori]